MAEYQGSVDRARKSSFATPYTSAMGHHLAIYPGSVDPITFGHSDVIQRGRRLFDELVVAVGRNPGKDSLFTPEERVEMVEVLVAGLVKERPGDAPVRLESFEGLTVDFTWALARTTCISG